MPSTVFTTPDAAEESYRAWRFAPVDPYGPNTDPDYDRRLFCKIATFFSDAASFESELRKVSAMLWDIYIDIPAQTHDRFTLAISSLAETRGFRMSAHRGPLVGHGAPMSIVSIEGAPGLGHMLRNRLFWTDSMGARHGEHSHSLQWLAAASRFGALASQAYAKAGLYRAANASPNQDAYVWRWLADCVPSDLETSATACTQPGSSETLCSDSYRSPHKITDYLARNPRAPLKDHFLSHYLHRRYATRPSGAAAKPVAKTTAFGWTSHPRPRAPAPKPSPYENVFEFHGRTGML